MTNQVNSWRDLGKDHREIMVVFEILVHRLDKRFCHFWTAELPQVREPKYLSNKTLTCWFSFHDLNERKSLAKSGKNISANDFSLNSWISRWQYHNLTMENRPVRGETVCIYFASLPGSSSGVFQFVFPITDLRTDPCKLWRSHG